MEIQDLFYITYKALYNTLSLDYLCNKGILQSQVSWPKVYTKDEE